MNKTNRLNIIKKIWQSRNPSFVVNATKSDLEDEASLVKRDDGKLEQEREAFSVSKEMLFPIGKMKDDDSESDFLLSRSEKEQLKRDISAYREKSMAVA